MEKFWQTGGSKLTAIVSLVAVAFAFTACSGELDSPGDFTAKTAGDREITLNLAGPEGIKYERIEISVDFSDDQAIRVCELEAASITDVNTATSKELADAEEALAALKAGMSADARKAYDESFVTWLKIFHEALENQLTAITDGGGDQTLDTYYNGIEFTFTATLVHKNGTRTAWRTVYSTPTNKDSTPLAPPTNPPADITVTATGDGAKNTLTITLTNGKFIGSAAGAIKNFTVDSGVIATSDYSAVMNGETEIVITFVRAPDADDDIEVVLDKTKIANDVDTVDATAAAVLS
ncbi:MAG: hypothetical protein Ta2A_00350 [Treponemataceae bacterium]|nr:MAG: hypothetical protein Ta2A_00350 [Treponemataceae bacterium]